MIASRKLLSFLSVFFLTFDNIVGSTNIDEDDEDLQKAIPHVKTNSSIEFSSGLQRQLISWTLLSQMPVKFFMLNQIEWFTLNLDGSFMFVATKDDQLYLYGAHGWTGVYSNQAKLVRIDSLCAKHIVGVASGEDHAHAWFPNGDIFAWGNNMYGQLGIGNSSHSATVKQPTWTGQFNVSSIKCGRRFTLVLTKEHTLHSYGTNKFGELGLGVKNQSRVFTPTHIESLGRNVKDFKVGSEHTLALTFDGHVYAWGRNKLGQLGTGNNANHFAPFKLTLDGANKTMSSIAVGNEHSLVLTTEGDVYAFGWNRYGQCSVDPHNASLVLKPVKVTVANLKFKAIASSGNMSAAQSTNGTWFVWGSISTTNSTQFDGAQAFTAKHQPVHLNQADLDGDDVIALFSHEQYTGHLVHLTMNNKS